MVAVAAVAIFNYQKSTSPVVASTLYALRTSPRARALLGDDIRFKRAIPWISGELNQVQGRIDIAFAVRGDRAAARMRFASRRPSPRGLFRTTDWTLTMEPDGRAVDLLDGLAADPFQPLLARDSAHPDLEHEPPTSKGFRQQPSTPKS